MDPWTQIDSAPVPGSDALLTLLQRNGDFAIRISDVQGDLMNSRMYHSEEVLAEPTLLAFGTVSELADRVGTSRPTIVRFANKLGFDGYTQLQRHVRSDLSHRLARPSERIRSVSCSP